MELFGITEIDTGTFRKVFKIGFLYVVITFSGTATIQFAAALAYINAKIPIVLLLIVSMFCVVYMYQCLFGLFRKIKPSNWLLAISDAAIYIKFRSCLYEHHPKEDKQIIRIKLSEIQAFRESHITDIIGRGRSKDRQKRVYLDIIVYGGLALLQKALAYEHSNYGLGKNRKSKIEISRLDFPVIVSQENSIQIDITGICPDKNSLVTEFKNLGIEELDVCNKEFDFTKLESTDDGASQRIVELLKAGRRLDARDAIWHVFHITRKQTHDMIKKLVQEHVLK